jgi:hypothetical protein
MKPRHFLNQFCAFGQSRKRRFILVFGVLMLTLGVHTLRQPRWYQATAVLQLPLKDDGSTHYSRLGVSGWNEIEVEFANPAFLQRVISRLIPSERLILLAPYEGILPESGAWIIESVIRQNVKVRGDRLERSWRVSCQYPDRQIAARIANLMVEEMISYQARLHVDASMRTGEDLLGRAQTQEHLVDKLAREIADLRAQRLHIGEDALQKDADYQQLQQKHARALALLAAINQRVRETTMMCGPEEQPWRIVALAQVPADDEYLRAPVIKDMARSFGFALSGAVLITGTVWILSNRDPDLTIP